MRIILTLGFLWAGLLVHAQLSHPKASPFQEITQEVGLSQVRVRYSRPAVKGREVFGNLVPYGRIWRVGANESTKISLSHNMTLGGEAVPAGTYALYAFPEASVWNIVIHKDTTLWGDGRDAYKRENDLVRFAVAPESWPEAQENFLITFDQITHNGMQMLLIWDRTCVRIPIAVNTISLMDQRIEKALGNEPTPQTYYEVARYLQEEGRDYQRALEYINKSLEGGETYYFYRVKSLILEGLGAYSEAIRAAKRSEALAAAEGKDEFVRMNQQNIKKWTGYLKE